MAAGGAVGAAGAAGPVGPAGAAAAGGAAGAAGATGAGAGAAGGTAGIGRRAPSPPALTLRRCQNVPPTASPASATAAAISAPRRLGGGAAVSLLVAGAWVEPTGAGGAGIGRGASAAVVDPIGLVWPIGLVRAGPVGLVGASGPDGAIGSVGA
jgi:hypothetical protein